MDLVAKENKVTRAAYHSMSKLRFTPNSRLILEALWPSPVLPISSSQNKSMHPSQIYSYNTRIQIAKCMVARRGENLQSRYEKRKKGTEADRQKEKREKDESDEGEEKFFLSGE